MSVRNDRHVSGAVGAGTILFTSTGFVAILFLRSAMLPFEGPASIATAAKKALIQVKTCVAHWQISCGVILRQPRGSASTPHHPGDLLRIPPYP
jgi:hypothetical protein